MTCAKCQRNLRRQTWYQDICDDIVLPLHPPGLPSTAAARAAAAPQPIATWTQFRTHMCKECELREKKRLRIRLNPPPANRLPARIKEMISIDGTRAYPYNTCICAYNLFYLPERVCLRHRHQIACQEHERLLVIRQQNDQCLRQTAKNPRNPNGVICIDRPRLRRKITHRATSRAYRACRCGADIDTGNVPEVLMCLGCEGVIFTNPATAANLPAGRDNERHLRSHDDEAFKLRRRRDNEDD